MEGGGQEFPFRFTPCFIHDACMVFVTMNSVSRRVVS